MSWGNHVFSTTIDCRVRGILSFPPEKWEIEVIFFESMTFIFAIKQVGVGHFMVRLTRHGRTWRSRETNLSKAQVDQKWTVHVL